MSVVQLADAKAQLNLTTTDDDVLVQAQIDAAESYLSAFVPNWPYGPSGTAPTPPAVLQAIKMLVSHLYENREASLVGVTVAELPFGLFDLLTPYRTWAF
jgi:Phage gp6-like head-tail connector protein